ncbi:DUF6412 domain-containing protein [Agromyces archimandritae]|uniref:Uncharacterized protein n=1 Tax=Agromyces archimandritae TaxID=2781962 RepID=A0A975FN85_9MICO|nr:DUF6412 domain-containing protein [Agromyces archimandritae]QTX05535.1 hypothetical protein G127AT_04785 [Agromyces archimandritae]
MIETPTPTSVTGLLQFLGQLAELAIASNAHLALVVLGLVGVAATAVLLTVRVMPALVSADPAGAATRLRQTVDPSRLLSQSDPDAPGRVRPRAPGLAFAAA